LISFEDWSMNCFCCSEEYIKLFSVLKIEKVFPAYSALREIEL
jgi:hypothetical protein